MSESRGSEKGSRVGGLLLILFGLPFLAVGCFATYRVISLLALWQDAQSWTEAQAHITRVDLKIHSGEDGSTYEVVCSYTYELDGNQYEGDRVGLEGGSDNIGDWQKLTHEQLKAAYEQNEPVRCYVDPKQPDRAVLFRELRPSMLLFWLAFAIVFSIAGLGIIAGGVYARRSAVRTASLRSANPEKPWLWKPEWASGTIRPATGLKALVIWVLAIFWNGLSWPVVGLLLPDAVGPDGEYWTLIFLIFPVIGLGMLVIAVRQTMQHFKFGRSYLELKTLPGVIGGRLTGDLVLHGKLGAVQAIDVKLSCQHRETTGTGKNQTTHTTTLWEAEHHYDYVAIFSQNQASLSIDFEIPADQRPSSNDIHWIVKATAPVPGVDLNLEFNVPVFTTGPNQ